jgi:predicted amidophosphoribosyltransferase
VGACADLLDILLPRRCLVCRGPADALCTACRGRLRRLSGPCCGRCGSPVAWPVARCSECGGRRLGFTRARAAVAYDDAARKVVTAWKEQGLRAVATLAGELVCEAIEGPPVYTVTFVPSDADRRLRRGHNSAERLARELGRRWQLPVMPLLIRHPGARPQRGLPLAERRRNVRGAFSPCGPSPPALVLVDDVYTSGATVSAAASALRRSGARRVEVVTFARAVR